MIGKSDSSGWTSWDSGFGKDLEDQVWIFIVSGLSGAFGSIFDDNAGNVELESKVLDNEVNFPGAWNGRGELEMSMGVICVIPPLFKGWIKAGRCKNLVPDPLDLKVFEVGG